MTGQAMDGHMILKLFGALTRFSIYLGTTLLQALND